VENYGASSGLGGKRKKEKLKRAMGVREKKM